MVSSNKVIDDAEPIPEELVEYLDVHGGHIGELALLPLRVEVGILRRVRRTGHEHAGDRGARGCLN